MVRLLTKGSKLRRSARNKGGQQWGLPRPSVPQVTGGGGGGERKGVMGGQQSNTKTSHGGRRHNKARSHARTMDEVTLPTKARRDVGNPQRRKEPVIRGHDSRQTKGKPGLMTLFSFPFHVFSRTTKELVIKTVVANVFQEGY